MPKVQLGDVTLNYQRRLGTGPDLVLVHGLGASLAFWYFSIVPRLSQDFCLTLFDLRGHGHSDVPQSGYTTADLATDLHRLLEHLQVKKVHLVGHSYGGAVALHYAALYPDNVLSLTLADARVRALQPIQRLADWPKGEVLMRKLKELDVNISLDNPQLEYRILEALAEAKLQGKELHNAVIEMFSPFALSSRSNRAAEQWLKIVRTTTACEDFTSVAGLTVEKIRKINTPVMAIFGEFSNCLPSCWGLKRHLSDCKVVIVPRAGHFHPIMRPAFFERNLRQFLKEASNK